MNPNGVNPNLMFAVTFGLFFVWMGRHHRWAYFIRAMNGTYVIRPASG